MTLCNVGGRLTSMKKLCMAIGSREGTEVSRTLDISCGRDRKQPIVNCGE